MALLSLVPQYVRVCTGPNKMPATLTPTIISDWLSEHINPHHLKAWLSLHFGKGGFYVNRYSGEEAVDFDGKAKKMYEVWAPKTIREVSITFQLR